jgi:hypothetical protein
VLRRKLDSFRYTVEPTGESLSVRPSTLSAWPKIKYPPGATWFNSSAQTRSRVGASK